ncbi:ATP-dependent Clp protease ATP-binding subunit [Apilactobacillus timberlakei]|uniref:AAA family ATPase n=1 Tax=Apilactobacillus timberlakei TaxID=2008380 RepID=UPI001126EE7F|nr:ATP-dependent Clp protease ATP-binding subunit [Apilactobacillus timberlakei]TPR14975.1 ATP-dependent Clp protease ATP-binding subunit [Apilactobacillus timberlakei]
MIREEDIPYLTHYAKNVNKLINNHSMYAIGREDEVNTTELVLLHSRKSNPILLGEAGVGKTNLVEGLAQKINTGSVPKQLLNYNIFEVNLGLMDTNFNGELGFFNENLSHIIEEATIFKDDVVLFIDEIHTIIGANSSKEKGMDASQLLKPPLARGDIHLIGATTFDEFHMYIEPDRAFQRRFTPVSLEEPSLDTSFEIIKKSIPSFARHYNCSIKIDDDAISKIVNLSDRYLTDQFLPDKAFDVLDGSISEKLLSNVDNKIGTVEIGIEEIALAIYRRTGILMGTIMSNLKPNVKHLYYDLIDRIKGQDEAMRQITNAISLSFAGMNDPRKPLASFLFLGTAGVGKTETARALAKNILNDESNMIRLDMGSYNTHDAVERLIGSSYKPGDLTGAVSRKPYSILLLDEIEKSTPAVRDLLLSILDSGELKDGRGRTINFRNEIIILTSNLCSNLIRKKSEWLTSDLPKGELEHRDKIFKSNIDMILHNYFRPELVDRFDNRIPFNVLTTFDMLKITEKYLKALEQRMLHSKHPLHLIFSSDVVEYLVDLTAMGNIYNGTGARPLMRVLQQYIGGRIANSMIRLEDDATFDRSKTIIVDAKGKKPDKTDKYGDREFIIKTRINAPTQEEEQLKKDIFSDENINLIIENQKFSSSNNTNALNEKFNELMNNN